MGYLLILLNVLLVFLVVAEEDGIFASGKSEEEEVVFDKNYKVIWGEDHAVSLNQGKEIQLSMDKSSGSGFGSKMSYGSGFFHLRIKVPDRDSAGVVTAYYLTSQGSRHDELDFEFLGNREGKPYTLQTNVFADGKGNREQRLYLWFYVDNIPIRVYKNKSNIGVGYPTKAMQIEASLWDGESWATDGGQTKTNWSCAPFKAYFQGFDISGCEEEEEEVVQASNYNNTPSTLSSSSSSSHCASDKYWWNAQRFWELDPVRQKAYENVKSKYFTYDYCSDKQRFPTPPLECS
ncbi:xyloglucan endotransglucosylase/hydrolase protein 2-like [Senna tora]|uniref:Xyloglucan endotransglucosylase/hydrolase n=1 Tax=Senna tora TaxID=362788 RepID=A0A834TPP0_9FABA|nr:xyloglucan endotransglucosylase/hydrolase protein 2-like [Senna tora]